MKHVFLLLLIGGNISLLVAQSNTGNIQCQSETITPLLLTPETRPDSIFGSSDSILISSESEISMNLDIPKKKNIFNSPYSRFIIPSALISYGVITQGIKSLKDLDTSTNHEVNEHISEKSSFDNYLQHVPLVATFGLDLVGVKAKHNLRDRALITATSYIIMGGTVLALKSAINIERPDGSSKNSFPSGHTATAFVGAHILFKEYRDISPWIGVGGYAAATATGMMRVINKKHWVSDVITGAGVGILSAELGYMLLPLWHNILGIKGQDKSLVIVPAITTKNIGVGMSYTF